MKHHMIILFIGSIISIIVFGIITTYTDIKFKKAYNRHTLLFFFLGLLIQISSVILDFEITGYVCTNISLSILLSITFYYMRFWAAGDAKLFIAMIMLIPYQLYNVEVGTIFPSFFILEYIFTAALLYIIIESVSLTIIDIRKRQIGRMSDYLPQITPKYIVSWLVSFLVADSVDIMLCIYNSSLFESNRYLLIVINILVVMAINTLIEKLSIKIIVAIVIILLRIVLFIVLNIALSSISVWSIIITTITMFIRSFTSLYNYQTVPVSKIRTGDVLTRATVFLMSLSSVNGLPKYTDETTRYLINDDEVKAIKRWEHSKYGQNSITIVRTIPFAPFIFGGVLIYFTIKLFIGV